MCYRSQFPAFGAEAPEDLIGQVKSLQKADPAAREQWDIYSDNNNSGRRDPAKHTPASLRTFLTRYSSGSCASPQAAPQDQNVNAPAFTKMMQRRCPAFRQLWAQHCDAAGGGKHDPLKHPAEFHIQFIEELARRCVGAGSNGAYGEPAPKRQRMVGPMGGAYANMGGAYASMGGAAVAGMGMSAGSGDTSKEKLVFSIKAYQRTNVQQKDTWESHCDMELGGVRDPNRHDVNTLMDFCQRNGVPELSPPGGGMRASNGPGIVDKDPVKANLVQAIKNFQRQGEENRELWQHHCDANLGGTRDPSRLDVEHLNTFVQTYGLQDVGDQHVKYIPGSDPDKDSLITQVKDYQRSGEEQKQHWYDFCGAMLDPSRHEPERLQEFLTMYGLF